MIIRPNGWQRLWIVTSIIYFFIVLAFTFTSFPKHNDITRRWAYETIDVIRDSSDPTWEIRKAYDDISDEALIERIHKKYNDEDKKKRFDRIDIKFKNEISHIPVNILDGIWGGFLGWFIPVAILYALGMAVGWIYRGFKRS